MKDNLILEDKIYISAKRVQELFGYTSDYVGQLCRSGKLECKMIGRSWFVTEKSIIDHRSNVNEILKSKIKEKRKSSQKLYRTFNAPVSEAPVSEPLVESVIDTVIEQKPKQNPPTFLIAPPHPIVSVPEIFALPYFVSEEFMTSPFSDVKKSSGLFSSKFVVSTGMLFVSLFFVFQSFSINKIFLDSVPGNIVTTSVASVISVSSDYLSKLTLFFTTIPKFAMETFSGRTRLVPSTNFNGIAVVPSSNSVESDEIIKDKIRASFSDEVVVKPDNSKTAGVITPVFRKVKGDDFVYVLVPVNDKN